ncbi:MAG: RNA-directed DNA polymerase [Oligoflexales bacterium]
MQRLYCTRIQNRLKFDYKWVVHFDLAAFYDTISHDILVRCLLPRKATDELGSFIYKCLSRWTGEKTSDGKSHGIPQGPITSDLLAEYYLMPIDEKMNATTYCRYVDDVRIFGKTENAARKSVVYLEILCRDLGLIPQSKKFEVLNISNAPDFSYHEPSPDGASRDISTKKELEKGEAEEIFDRCFNETGMLINKSQLRYVLFHSMPSSKIRLKVLKIWQSLPEHVDAFLSFLTNHISTKSVILAIQENLKSSPYDYVQGQCWQFLSVALEHIPAGDRTTLRRRATDLLKERKVSFSARLGIHNFLVCHDNIYGTNLTNWLLYENYALIQAILAPLINDKYFGQETPIVKRFLSRSLPEPGIMLSSNLARLNISFPTSAIHNSQVASTFSELGICGTPSKKRDPISIILKKHFKTDPTKKWKTLLGSDYGHAVSLLKQANVCFDSSRDKWLGCMNSFNHLLIYNIQVVLNQKNIPGAIALKNKNNVSFKEKYGHFLDPGKSFAKHHPQLVELLGKINDRRNILPGSHPYAEKGTAYTKRLTMSERTQMKDMMSITYSLIVVVLKNIMGETD